jgi:hypothetical protein
LIEFENQKDAADAIKEMNGEKFYEQEVHVDWAFVKSESRLPVSPSGPGSMSWSPPVSLICLTPSQVPRRAGGGATRGCAGSAGREARETFYGGAWVYGKDQHVDGKLNVADQRTTDAKHGKP